MLSAAFAHVLAQRRASFNGRVALARSRTPGFDTDAFSGFLQEAVDPLTAAVPDPTRVADVVEAAFDMALALSPSHRPLAGEICTGLAIRHVALVAAQPVDTLAALVNGALHLQEMPGARTGEWVERMGALAPQVTSTAQLRAVGQVLAWRAGAAHFRAGALAAADTLPPALALAALGLPANADWPALRAQLASDPYCCGADGQRDREAGAFTGFGGAFAAPPSVRACDAGFMVASGDRYFLLIADAYGAVLHGASLAEYEAAAGNAYPAVFSLAGATLDLPEFGLRACCNAHAVAITSPYTHAIRVLALP